MKVRATQMGFRDGSRVRPGTVFEIPDSEKPSTWMEVIKAGQPEKPAPKKVRNEPQTLSEMGREMDKKRTLGEP